MLAIAACSGNSRVYVVGYQQLMKLMLGEDCMANVTHFAPFLPKSSGLDGGVAGKCDGSGIYW